MRGREMGLAAGIDEVGYGPKLGPLVVTAVAARGPLRTALRIADSKKVFSQARGVGTLEPAVLGFVPAATFAEFVTKLGAALPDAPWYRAPLALPSVPREEGLVAAGARIVDAAEFNRETRTRNKADLLFEVAAGLINRIRAGHAGPIAFFVGKQGGRRFYREGLERSVHPAVTALKETRATSTYRADGAVISFLRDAEDRHELVALASMVGKYVRECAMRLFNDYWTARVPGLRPTAGYGTDASRFFREIEPALAAAGLAREDVLRLR